MLNITECIDILLDNENFCEEPCPDKAFNILVGRAEICDIEFAYDVYYEKFVEFPEVMGWNS